MVKLPLSRNRGFGWDDMPGNVSGSLRPLEYCFTPIALPARAAAARPLNAEYLPHWMSPWPIRRHCPFQTSRVEFNSLCHSKLRPVTGDDHWFANPFVSCKQALARCDDSTITPPLPVLQTKVTNPLSIGGQHLTQLPPWKVCLGFGIHLNSRSISSSPELGVIALMRSMM